MECVLLPENQFSYQRMCSLTREYDLLPENVFSYQRICSLTRECVLLLQCVRSASCRPRSRKPPVCVCGRFITYRKPPAGREAASLSRLAQQAGGTSMRCAETRRGQKSRCGSGLGLRWAFSGPPQFAQKRKTVVQLLGSWEPWERLRRSKPPKPVLRRGLEGGGRESERT